MGRDGHNLGPPGNDEGGPPRPAATTHHQPEPPPHVKTRAVSEFIAVGSRQCGDTVGMQLRRRRTASYKCEQLPSGYRDPFQPWRPETLSDKQVEAAGIAARHLLDMGVVPRFDTPTLRALWRRGDRALAQELYELCGGDT